MFPLFPLGQIVATPRALAALERAKQPPTCFLARHAIGDWGELEPTHVAENELQHLQSSALLRPRHNLWRPQLWQDLFHHGPREVQMALKFYW